MNQNKSQKIFRCSITDITDYTLSRVHSIVITALFVPISALYISAAVYLYIRYKSECHRF